MKKEIWVIGCLLLAVFPARSEDKKSSDFPQLEEVIVVYKTHFDIGYSDLARNVVHKYRTEMLDHALDNIEKNSNSPKEEQFVWTVPGWPMKQILWEGQKPDRREAIEKSLSEGNLVVHAFPFTTHTGMNELEDLVRGLGYASDIARQYKLELPRASKMTDVPSHVWSLPTLLHHAGVEFFHFGCNSSNRMPLVPTLFWWEGPDHSRLLTMASQGYGTSVLPPKGWPYKAWIYINQTGDNMGPPSPETVQENLEFYKKNLPGVKVKIGQLSDFSDAILKSGAELPVVRGDMPDSWIHGPMGSPDAVALSRRTKLLVGTAENMQTQENLWGVYLPDETKTYRDAYELSLLFGEHTWGMASQHYRTPLYGKSWEDAYTQGLPNLLKRMEDSWDEHDNYIRSSADKLVRPLANQVAALADNVNQAGRRIVVYNPLPWKRNGFVTVDIYNWPHPKAVKPVDGEELIPAYFDGNAQIGEKRGFVTFEARDIPPMGYRTFTMVSDHQMAVQEQLKADEKERTIESPYFKVRMNVEEGRIESFVDKRTNRELVDADAPQGFGQYFYERFGKADVMKFLNAYLYPNSLGFIGPVTGRMSVPENSVYQSAVAKRNTFKIEQTPLEISAVMTGEIPGPGMPQSVSMRLTLYATQPYADLTIGVNKKPDAWPEAGWICLPFKMEQAEFRLGRLGCVTDPKKDIVENSNFRMLWLNTGMTIHNEQGGIGICPLDSPLVSLGEPGSHRFDRKYVPQNPYVFVNLYNNTWATNFREWWGGELSSTVRLWTFEKFNEESSLFTLGMEARVPLLAARSACKPGNLSVSQSGIELSRKGIQITTFGQNPDGDGLVLRLWEQSGQSGSCRLTFPKGWNFSKIQPVDLRGRKIGDAITVKEGGFSFDLKGFAPASFVIEK